jgi:hypothetical protein
MSIRTKKILIFYASASATGIAALRSTNRVCADHLKIELGPRTGPLRQPFARGDTVTAFVACQLMGR